MGSGVRATQMRAVSVLPGKAADSSHTAGPQTPAGPELQPAALLGDHLHQQHIGHDTSHAYCRLESSLGRL